MLRLYSYGNTYTGHGGAGEYKSLKLEYTSSFRESYSAHHDIPLSLPRHGYEE